MVFSELIAKKRDGLELSTDEINYFVNDYTKGIIPDYQASAMLMAILLKGMNKRETYDLTMAMMNSGDTIDLSYISGIKADKHSTGGVGDKTSLILTPMVAACGLKIAKMSGRGLGHTGGTLDKLESIPGFTCELTPEKFKENVDNIGIAIIGQTAELVPADKKLYAMRDLTATVASVPLIVSSIMSKKLASGSDVIVLDVKCGEGSFMKTIDEAETLAKGLVDIGNNAGRKCSAVISDMSQPLGFTVGNALEVKEAIAVLRGEQKGDVLDLCLTLGSRMLVLSGFAKDDIEAASMLIYAIESGLAFKKFTEFIEGQGGDISYIINPDLLPKAECIYEVKSGVTGYVESIDALEVGLLAMRLGGGRRTKTDIIDHSVGVVLNKKVGDKVEPGELIATIHAKTLSDAQEGEKSLLNSIKIVESKVCKIDLIKKIID